MRNETTTTTYVMGDTLRIRDELLILRGYDPDTTYHSIDDPTHNMMLYLDGHDDHHNRISGDTPIGFESVEEMVENSGYLPDDEHYVISYLCHGITPGGGLSTEWFMRNSTTYLVRMSDVRGCLPPM